MKLCLYLRKNITGLHTERIWFTQRSSCYELSTSAFSKEFQQEKLLVDYVLQKSPYWSVNNYEKRVEEQVLVAFLRYVEQSHKDNQEELKLASKVSAHCFLESKDCLQLFSFQCLVCRNLAEHSIESSYRLTTGPEFPDPRQLQSHNQDGGEQKAAPVAVAAKGSDKGAAAAAKTGQISDSVDGKASPDR